MLNLALNGVFLQMYHNVCLKVKNK